MKTLYLVRHAKSSWKHPELSDFDRPLNKRGKRDAPYMGKIMKEMGVQPDLIISSPAKRAITTAKEFAEQMNYPEKHIKADKRIYFNTTEDLLAVISEVKETISHLMLFGHNPAFTEMANQLSGNEVDNIPTAAVFAVNFEVNGWDKIHSEKGSFRFFEYPKKYNK